MNARQLIEAEDPKSVLRNISGYVTMDDLRRALEPYGFTFTDDVKTYGEVGMVKTTAPIYGVTRRFFVSQDEGYAYIAFYRDYGDGKGFRYEETLRCSNMRYLLNHLRLFHLVEAESPKSVLK